MLANTDHQAPATVVFCNGAAIKLRLMEEQACGCSTVRGGQRLKVRVLVSADGTRGADNLLANTDDQAPALVVFCNGAAIKLRLMEEQACGCSTV